MDFINQFTAHAILAALVAGLWFSVPGAWVGRWLGWYPQLRLSTLLVAPFLGLCTFGAFSLVLTTMIGYSTFTLGCSWLLFQLLVLLASRRHYSETEVFYPLSMPLSVLLLVGIGLWALIPTLHIMPFVDQNALFVDKHIYDHAKIALVDAIAREGLLPINPYYAPGGETILLNYYYSWHFLVSQLKLLLPISGWQAEVAMSWFTGFAVVGLLAALAIQITQKARAGFLLLLCAALGQPTASLYAHFNLEWKQWFAYPSEHGLELLLDQMMWVPQHVFSATAVVLVIFLVSRLLLTQRLQMHYIVIGGLTVATAFGASTWIGGIGLLLASPIFLLLVLSLRLPKSHYFNLFKALLLMALIGIAAALPLLISQTAGPHADLPFSLSIYQST
ncbi:MAG: hypothetical protein SVR94_07755, partial [Pseudomonadota bacterium]|nr:hypothetical protein [Pseudomonadota bacterium]